MSLFAPGQSITSSTAGGGFAVASGTSMAAPHVAGAWAILKQAAPSSSVDQIFSALQSTGLPITDSRPGGSVTRPRIRVADALSALTPTPVLTVTPASVVPGGTVTATWSGIPAPTPGDWIGLYVPGSGNTAYLAWILVSCSQGREAAVVAGWCALLRRGGLTTGTSERRL